MCEELGQGYRAVFTVMVCHYSLSRVMIFFMSSLDKPHPTKSDCSDLLAISAPALLLRLGNDDDLVECRSSISTISCSNLPCEDSDDNVKPKSQTKNELRHVIHKRARPGGACGHVSRARFETCLRSSPESLSRLVHI